MPKAPAALLLLDPGLDLKVQGRAGAVMVPATAHQVGQASLESSHLGGVSAATGAAGQVYLQGGQFASPEMFAAKV
jgi:hypothetical protein